MRYLCIFLAILLSQSLFAAEISTKKISYKRVAQDMFANEDFVFFKVKSTNVELANKINQLVHLDQLGILPPKDEKTKLIVDQPSLRYLIPAEVEQNNRYINLSLDVEGCGAYCEEYQVYYVFDATTGHRISTRDLLKAQSMLALKADFQERRKKRINQEIKFLESEIKKEGYADLIEDDLAMIDIYRECLDRDYGPYKFHIENNRLVLTAERCANHAMRGLDGVGDFSYNYTSKELKPYLTPYGKWLLSSASLPTVSNPINSINFYEKLLKGKIGRADITFRLTAGYDRVLEKVDGVSGQYFYNKYQIPIELLGELKNELLELKEGVGDKVNASMQLSFVNDDKLLLKGFWQSGDKKLPVEIYK